MQSNIAAMSKIELLICFDSRRSIISHGRYPQKESGRAKSNCYRAWILSSRHNLKVVALLHKSATHTNCIDDKSIIQCNKTALVVCTFLQEAATHSALNGSRATESELLLSPASLNTYVYITTFIASFCIGVGADVLCGCRYLPCMDVGLIGTRLYIASRLNNCQRFWPMVPVPTRPTTWTALAKR